MKNFKSELRSKGLSQGSVDTYTRIAEVFTQWLEANCIEVEHCTYPTILEYLEEGKAKNYAQSTLHLQLRGIKKYLDYIGLDPNPACLKLRPRSQTLPNGLLTEEELKMIYRGYPKKYLRNKVVLGLIIFQALRLGDIKRLKRESIDLENCKIEISGHLKSNHRYINLEAAQMVPMQEYLQSHDSEKVFPTGRLHYIISYIMKQLKRTYPHLKEVRQLRSSVITNWLKKHNLREVQYLAGHRYVSSTERYQMNHLEDLQRDLDKFHPSN